uniref:Uncharacterized protein n=1 Tax=viral metagenome TaxID=1070528 RepID=A0A6C0LCQ3_9ZZZZ
MFKNNYLYELPDDIQAVIYKNVFARCIANIENDKSIKYLNRLYIAVYNPCNTCVYSIKPKGMFCDYRDSDREDDSIHEYKYERVALVEGFSKNDMKSMIYLDRTHLIEDISQSRYNIISFYIFPLFTASKKLRKYLSNRINIIKYYDKRMIENIVVVEDRVDIVFTRNMKCNADIYYNIMVGYNVLYNSLSNIIYSEENVVMFNKFVEIFRWIEMNNIFEGYNIYNNKIIPMFEAKLSKK